LLPLKKRSCSYKELEENSIKYEGTPVSFTGEVLQIQEEELEVSNIKITRDDSEIDSTRNLSFYTLQSTF
jgi:hypothetical protein